MLIGRWFVCLLDILFDVPFGDLRGFALIALLDRFGRHRGNGALILGLLGRRRAIMCAPPIGVLRVGGYVVVYVAVNLGVDGRGADVTFVITGRLFG